MRNPRPSLVIVTKNRPDDLAVAVQSARTQSIPIEIIVIDDGSTVANTDLVAERFPEIRFVRHEESRGYIVRRNEGMRLANADIVFSLDDDAAFSTPLVVERTLADFGHPRIGAVAIPFIDVRKGTNLQQFPADGREIWLTSSFVGTAHAVRRDAFLEVGGYRDFLVHQGEESDLCIRLLERGVVVRLGNADPIHHFESPRRDFTRMDIYGRRNDVLSAWLNVPAPFLLPHLAATTFNGLRHGLRSGRFGNALRGLGAGYASMAAFWKQRHAVRPKTYRLFRMLRRANADHRR